MIDLLLRLLTLSSCFILAIIGWLVPPRFDKDV